MSHPLLSLLLVGLAAATFTTSAHADSAEECANAASRGQTLRDGGQLLEARSAFGKCVEATCPAQVRKDCSEWYTDVEQRTPSVVVRVVGLDGKDALDATATLDGNPVTLDGRAVAVNPGRHTVVAERPRGLRTQSTLVLSEAEKSRVATLVLDASASDGTRRTAGYVLLGVGGAALATAAVVGFVGLRQWVDLESDCRPRCSSGDVASARTKFVIADVALGVSLLALGAGVVLLLTAPKAPAASASGPGLVRF